jgi:hypothetical protein
LSTRFGKRQRRAWGAVVAALGLALGVTLWARASHAQQSSTTTQTTQTTTSSSGSTTRTKSKPATDKDKAGSQAGAGGAAKGQPGNGQAPAAAGASGTALGTPPPDMGNIDQILEGDEEVLAGANGFTYDPGNRRDPFKSLLIAPDRPEFRGPRPEGIPGLLIDEIDLKGIIRTARGYIAEVSASNQKKSFLLKEGDQLYDGDVVSIGKNEVVFKQIVQDPTALKPFREIVKSMNQQ